MILKFKPTREKEYYQPPSKDLADAGWDFHAAKTVHIYPMQFAQVPTNISIALPANHWGLLLGRSSTFFKRRLMVHQGTIDSGYRGEIMGLVFNPTTDKVTVRAGDRVFQLIVISMPSQQKLYEVEELPKSKRGDKGFGSTGT